MQQVAILGVPRSGTSWLGQIFNSSPQVAYRYQPLFAYSFPGMLNRDSTPREIRLFHQKLLQTDDEFVCQKKNISGNKTPNFHKTNITHLIWKEVRYLDIIETLLRNSSTMVVGIIRHPCGVLKSWMKAPKEFKPEWTIEQEWRYASKKNSGTQDFFGYERWLKVSEMFIELEKTYPKQFRTITYESLLRDLHECISSLFSFTGLKLMKQTKEFLEESTSTSSTDPYDVYRKSKSGYEWKGDLPAEIIDQIFNDKRFLRVAKYYGWDNKSTIM